MTIRLWRFISYKASPDVRKSLTLDYFIDIPIAPFIGLTISKRWRPDDDKDEMTIEHVEWDVDEQMFFCRVTDVTARSIEDFNDDVSFLKEHGWFDDSPVTPAVAPTPESPG